MQTLKQSRSTPTQDVKVVPVVVRAGEGKTVLLSGDFNGWTREGIPMKSLGDGRYKAQLKLAPGTYQFRLLVDGEWADDLDARNLVSNSFGTVNSVLQVT
jgi:hypothetical protein